MKLVGPAPDELDTKAVKIVRWYDPSMRLWIVYPQNAAGDQIGEAQFPYGSAYSLQVAKDLAKDAGLPFTAITKDL